MVEISLESYLHVKLLLVHQSTQFYTASDNGTDPNEFGSLEWQISNPRPGLGALVQIQE